MVTFQSIGVPDFLSLSLKRMSFDKPTPIQAKVIPIALEGRDIIGSAETGTGKTGAFGIPIINQLIANADESALIITPTRELAAQAMNQLKNIISDISKIESALLIGGSPINKQLYQLNNRPRLIVGTPGRINDLLKRKNLFLNKISFLVLDEADRMFDMGFLPQIENIISFTSIKRQTLLFSATISKRVIKIADKYLNNPLRVSIGTTFIPTDNIKQDTLKVSESEKYSRLLDQLTEREGFILVFVRTKYSAEKTAKRLSKDGLVSCAMHGNLRQRRRENIISDFRKKKYRILIATDIAARGLDIQHIDHVINYDLPECTEDYFHRIGRTARAGAKGSALSFITNADKNKWQKISNFSNGKKDQESSFGRSKISKSVKKRSYNFRDNSKHSKKSNRFNKRLDKNGFFDYSNKSDRPFSGRDSRKSNFTSNKSKNERRDQGALFGKSKFNKYSSKGKKPFIKTGRSNDFFIDRSSSKSNDAFNNSNRKKTKPFGSFNKKRKPFVKSGKRHGFLH
jgi:ATP-dependent RNA helicase DeaD